MVVQRYPTTASKTESRNMEDALTFLGVPDGLSVTHTILLYGESGPNTSAVSVLKAEINLNVFLGIIT